MYPEYTGTGLLAILQPPSTTVSELIHNRDSVYNYVTQQFNEKYNLTWLKPIGFNNAYALMMRRNESNELNIHTISQLANYVETH